MKVHLIVLRDDDNLTISDAWDDDSVALNHEGFQESVLALQKSYKPENVRVVVADIDWDAVRAAFDPHDVGEMRIVTTITDS